MIDETCIIVHHLKQKSLNIYIYIYLFIYYVKLFSLRPRSTQATHRTRNTKIRTHVPIYKSLTWRLTFLLPTVKVPFLVPIPGAVDLHPLCSSLSPHQRYVFISLDFLSFSLSTILLSRPNKTDKSAITYYYHPSTSNRRCKFMSPLIRLGNIRSRYYCFTANLTLYAVNLRVEKMLQTTLRNKT
jgi:hypothetical protein